MLKNNMLIILSVFLVLILFVGSVSAADENDSQILSQDTDEIITIEVSSAGTISGLKELESDNNLSQNSLNTESNLFSSQNDFLDSQASDDEIYAATPGTFADLNTLIRNAGSNSVITLTRDYVYTPSTDKNFKDGVVISSSNVTIVGNGHTIDGKNTARIFDVTGGGNLFYDINFINGYTTSYLTFGGLSLDGLYPGGAIWLRGNYNIISNCTFVNNFARNGGLFRGWGGAIFVRGSNCRIVDSTFINNTAQDYLITNNFGLIQSDGGAILVNANNVVISHSTFINNSATNGGAISFHGISNWQISNGSVIDCYFENNHAQVDGSAIDVNKYCIKNFVISDCYFANNLCRSNNTGAGTVTIKDIQNANISNSVFINNTALDGAAIGMSSVTNYTIYNCDFINNSAVSSGEDFGYYVEEPIYLGHGGAIFIWKSFDGHIVDCTFENNTAAEGGGAIFWDLTSIPIYYSIISSDYVSGCSFVNNSVVDYGGDGGAIYYLADIEKRALSNVYNSSFVNNSARAGGAIYSNVLNEVSNSNFIDNKVLSTYLNGVKDSENLIITFTFEGNENYINGIYVTGSKEPVYNNVTYWYDAYVANSDNVNPVRSIREVGINITVEVYNSDGELVDNYTAMTDTNGQIIYDYSRINYHNCTYKAYHYEDNYYTYIETYGDFECWYNIVVLNNKTCILVDNFTFELNATLYDADTNKSINPDDVRLFFILPNGTEVEATNNGGVWTADYYFSPGEYEISARVEPEDFIYWQEVYSLYKVFNGKIISTSTSPELSINKSAKISRVGVDGLVNFTIEISNSNLTPVFDITVWDVLPAGSTLVSSSEGYGYKYINGTYKRAWTISYLAPGETAYFWIVARPTQVGLNVNTAFLHQQYIGDLNDTASVEVIAPELSINKSVNVNRVGISGLVNFTIVVNNSNLIDAYSITVRDVLPSGLTFVSASTGYSLSGSQISWTLSNLAAGNNASYWVVARATQAGLKENIASLIHRTCNINDTAVVEVIAPELSLNKSVNIGVVGINDLVNFTIVVNNSNLIDAYSITVRDVLPSGLTFVSASTGYSLSGSQISWTLSNLAAGNNASYWVVARATQAGLNENTATITNSYTGTLNDTATVDVRPPELSLNKSANVSSVGIGGLVNFTIVVNNSNSSNSGSITVRDVLPSGLTFVSASNGYSRTGSRISWTLSNLAKGNNASFWVVARATQAGLKENTATITNTYTGTLTDTATVDVLVPELSINKSADVSKIGVNGLVNFTIVVNNSNLIDAYSITVSDVLPSGLTFVNASNGYTRSGSRISWSLGYLASGSNASYWVVAKATQTGLKENTASIYNSYVGTLKDTATVEVVPVILTVNKTANVSSVLTNDEITFTINVTNTGYIDATNVVVRDYLPWGLELVDGNTSSVIDLLIVNESRLFIIKAKAISGGNFTNIVNVWCKENSTIVRDYATVEVINPFSVNKTANVTVTNISGLVNFTIEITNGNPVDAYNITVWDELPFGLIFVNASEGYYFHPEYIGTEYENSVICWHLDYLAADSTTSVWVVAKAIQLGIQENRVTIYSPDMGYNQDNAIVNVTGFPPELSINKTANITTLGVGDLVNFTIEISNSNLTDAYFIEVLDLLPEGLVFVNASEGYSKYQETIGTQYEDRYISWTLDYLSAGSSTSLWIVARATQLGIQENIAGTRTIDMNNYIIDSADVEVVSPELRINKTANVDDINLGGLVNFTIEISNSNITGAYSINVIDVLPEGLAFVNASEGYFKYQETIGTPLEDRYIGWTLDYLAAGSSTSLWIVARATQAGLQQNLAYAICNGKLIYDSDTVNVTEVHPELSINKTVNVGTVGLYGLVNFTIEVYNNYSIDAYSINVIDVLPEGLVVVDASEGYYKHQETIGTEYEYRVCYWDFDYLAAGESISVWIVANATKLGVQINEAAAVCSGMKDYITDTATVEVVNPISINKTANVTTVGIGGLVNFTIEISNTGSVDLYSIEVLDVLPEGLVFVNASEGYSKYPPSIGTQYEDREISWTLNYLAAGQSTSVWIVAKTTRLGTYENDAGARLTGMKDYIIDYAIVDVIPGKLSINKTANVTVVGVGDLVNFTIEITSSITDASTFLVSDGLPSGLVFVDASEGYYNESDSSGEYSAILSWIVESMPVDSSISFWIVAKTTEMGNYTNLAVVHNDYNLEYDNATVQVVNCSLSVNKTANVSSVYVGDSVAFTINVTNTGRDVLTGIFVDEIIPDGLVYDNFTGPNWTKVGTRFLYDGSLGVGESVEMTIIFTATKEGKLTNVVVAGSDYAPNSTSEASIEVLNPSLTIRVISNNPEVMVGEPVSFTIVVTNDGNIDLGDVYVVNVFPDGLIYTGFNGSACSKVSSISASVYKSGILGDNNNDEQDYDIFTYSGVLKAGESFNYTVYFNTTRKGTFVVEGTANSNMTSGAYSNNNTVVKDSTTNPNPNPTPTHNPDSTPSQEQTPSQQTAQNLENATDIRVDTGSTGKKMAETGNPIVLLLITLVCLPILRRKN